MRQQGEDRAVELKKFMIGTRDHLRLEPDARIRIVKNNRSRYPFLRIAWGVDVPRKGQGAGPVGVNFAPPDASVRHLKTAIAEARDEAHAVELRYRPHRIEHDRADIFCLREAEEIRKLLPDFIGVLTDPFDPARPVSYDGVCV